MGSEVERRPLLAQRYETGESKTNSLFTDGKPVFRRVVALTGGNGTSTVTVAALANLIDVLVRADVSVNDGTNLEMNNGTAVGVLIIEATGAITATHAGQDYTGDAPIVILEYTKQ